MTTKGQGMSANRLGLSSSIRMTLRLSVIYKALLPSPLDREND